MERFKRGMYGGKFFPFHKGHLYCVETAAKKCEKLYVILNIRILIKYKRFLNDLKN